MPEQTISPHLSQKNFADKISNVAQVGGIETSVIDNGYGRGTRIAWINTASGLRYKVVIDRAMDIAEAFFNQFSVAWLSRPGIVAPQPFADKGTDWLRTFGGGLLSTCGLSHVGGPEKDEYGERGLHGLVSNIPAELVSIQQPDPFRGIHEMSITGKIRETSTFGPHLELKRTITSVLGESWLQITDEVTNLGNTPAPHMLLYHFNFGWPLADEGTELIFDGPMYLLNKERDSKFFNNERDFRKCPAPLAEHRDRGEAAAYFDVPANDNGECICGLLNHKLGIGASLTFRKNELPWFTNWQHWAPGEYVTGLEPGTHPPIGQMAARKQNSLIFIEPGETKNYQVKVEVFNSEAQLNRFQAPAILNKPDKL